MDLNKHFLIFSKVKDATAALIVVFLLFTIPANLDFLNAFSKDSMYFKQYFWFSIVS